MSLPSGTVALLFTDIEGSARLWDQAPPAMEASLRRLFDVSRLAKGLEPKNTFLSFEDARQADESIKRGAAPGALCAYHGCVPPHGEGGRSFF